MEDREKQIEEIETIIKSNLAEGSFANAFARKVAIQIVEHYQSKLLKDSVVLSREEFEKYQNLKRDVEYSFEYNQGYTDGQIKGSKETAEKFVNETMKRKQTLMNPYTDNESECVSTYWIYEIAKRLGVKIKG